MVSSMGGELSQMQVLSLPYDSGDAMGTGLAPLKILDLILGTWQKATQGNIMLDALVGCQKRPPIHLMSGLPIPRDNAISVSPFVNVRPVRPHDKTLKGIDHSNLQILWPEFK